MTSEALERCDALNWCLYQRAPRPRRTLSPSITLWKPAGDLIIITLSCPDSPDGLTPFECARFSPHVPRPMGWSLRVPKVSPESS